MELVCEECGSDNLKLVHDDAEDHILHYVCQDCGHHMVHSYQPEKGGDDNETTT